MSLYSAGNLVDGVVSNAIGAFAFFYMNIVCGLAGSVAGALLAVSIADDAVADPAIGYASDNTRSRWGRRHPLQAGRIAPDVVRNLGLIAGPIAGAIALTSAFVLVGYRLDANRYAEIRAELERRRAVASA